MSQHGTAARILSGLEGGSVKGFGFRVLAAVWLAAVHFAAGKLGMAMGVAATPPPPSAPS